VDGVHMGQYRGCMATFCKRGHEPYDSKRTNFLTIWKPVSFSGSTWFQAFRQVFP